MDISGTSSLLASRYRLREPIAAGAMGEVWRADDEVLGRAVAVKLLRSEYAGHAEILARFQAEARHASMLAHPGIVQVYDYGQDIHAGVPFLVMELIEGPSLAAVLGGGPQRPSWVLPVIGQVAAGLAAAHAAGVVHRDIKPANLLLTPDGMVKITDFGIAFAAGSAPLTQDGTVACTPGYLAPERAAGSPAEPASDVYSLGILAWEALTGEPPFTGTPIEIALAHIHRDLPPLPASVPAGLTALVAAMTSKHPAARPAASAVAARAGQLRSQPEQRMFGSFGRPGRPVLLTAAGVAATAALAAVLVNAADGTAGQHPAPARASTATAVPAVPRGPVSVGASVTVTASVPPPGHGRHHGKGHNGKGHNGDDEG